MDSPALWKRFVLAKPQTLLKHYVSAAAAMDTCMLNLNFCNVINFFYLFLLYFFYRACSNFPRIYGQVTAAETYEGENTVLWLQAARLDSPYYTDIIFTFPWQTHFSLFLCNWFYLLLLGIWLRLVKKNLEAWVCPIWLMKKLVRRLSIPLLKGSLNFFDALLLGMTFKSVCHLNERFQQWIIYIRLVDVAISQLDKYAQSGQAPHDAWNNASVYLIKAAQAHARYVVVDRYVSSIKEGNFSAPIRTILSQLCELFLIYWLLERSGDFFLVNTILSSWSFWCNWL